MNSNTMVWVAFWAVVAAACGFWQVGVVLGLAIVISVWRNGGQRDE